ncbi:MAG: hypothetical protein IJU98_12220 [Synergistaceae bacterium]|nr:hypothetical protein [Synergistaceae bacterium]
MQPISLLMSHFNVENNIHMTPNALAAAQDTAQGQEIVRDSIRITQTVQANEAAAEAQRVHRRNEDEEREDHRRDAQDTYSDSQNEEGEEARNEGAEQPLPEVHTENRPATKGFDFYV